MTKPQTKQSFKDKWQKNTDLAFAETLRLGSEINQWILSRNGWNTVEDLRSFLGDKKRILDAGCGNGRITALLREYSDSHKTEILGIDLVSAKIAEANLKDYKNVSFSSEDLLEDLSCLGMFDFIYCQEVLHHTGDPLLAFKNLCKLLKKGGIIAIYVYKKKGPVREFADDYIRNVISEKNYEEALKVCVQLAKLGRVLSDLNLKIQVPEISALEIDAGEYDLHRFIYHYFLKCFWNDSFSLNENAVINYDWYHPQNSTRHTLEEIKSWFIEENLEIVHEFTDFYGITIHGKKVKKPDK